MSNTKPLFIVFEGLDGSGKSTQIRLLEQKLLGEGRSVCTTAEPTNSVTGGLIRDVLSGTSPRTATELAGLFMTDRVAHNVNPVWGVKKQLADGRDVISDRYYYSSFAYQGISTDMDWVMDMNLNCPDIEKPDLCIYLDVDPDNCKKRIDGARSHLEIFEKDANMLREIRGKFMAVFDRLTDHNIVVINADDTPEEIAEKIYNEVSKLI